MTGRAQEFQRLVEESVEETPYVVRPTEDGFDLALDVEDHRWTERFRTGGLSHAMTWHVKVGDGRTYTILEDRRSVDWEAGVPRLGGRYERKVGRSVSGSCSMEWGRNEDGKFERTVDTTFDTDNEGRALIAAAAKQVGLRERRHWVVKTAIGLAVATGIGLLLMLIVLLWAVVSATDVHVSVNEQSSDHASRSGPEMVNGKIVGDAVEREVSNLLRREVEGLVPGKLDCRELEYEQDATTTCERAVVIDGHYMTLDVEVEITELKGKGKMSLYVQIADEVNTYGTTGEELERDIGQRAQKFYTLPVQAIDCPDLEGKEGHHVRCTLSFSGGDKVVQVTAYDVDLGVPTMSYRFREIRSPD